MYLNRGNKSKFASSNIHHGDTIDGHLAANDKSLSSVQRDLNET